MLLQLQLGNPFCRDAFMKVDGDALICHKLFTNTSHFMVILAVTLNVHLIDCKQLFDEDCMSMVDGGTEGAHLEPGKSAKQGEYYFIVCLLKSDAFQLPHGRLQKGVDLHDCHGMFKAVRRFPILQHRAFEVAAIRV